MKTYGEVKDISTHS